MNFASVDKIVAMYQGIDKGFVIAAFHIVEHLFAGIRRLSPHLAGVAHDEVLAVFQKGNQTSFIFGVIQCINRTTALGQAIPACAEDTRPADGAVVSKEGSGIA